MTMVLSDADLSAFSDFITHEIGLYFPKEKWGDLEKGIRAASHAFKFKDMSSCMQWLMSSPLNQQQAKVLASVLTVGETYFFRDSQVFDMLEQHILPSLIFKRRQDNQRHLRIWSAGCSSGEEPYSIAILLYKLIPDIKEWNITLLATDINVKGLEKLTKGEYTEWSFRHVSDAIKTTYFKTSAKNKYDIIPAIKNMIEPFYLNLAQDIYPSLANNTNAMDIIFCRNVLMYFSPPLAKKVVEKFDECLVDDGYLMVSAVEAPLPYFLNLKSELINGITFYKKLKTDTPAAFEPINDIDLPIIPLEEKSKNISPEYKTLTEEYANKGMLQEALAINDKAISENKMDTDLYYLRGMILFELNKYDEAKAIFNRLLYLDNKYILAYIMLGHILQKNKMQREALNHFNCALTLLEREQPDKMIGDFTVERLVDVIHSMRVTR